jgi:hypothetical protein
MSIFHKTNATPWLCAATLQRLGSARPHCPYWHFLVYRSGRRSLLGRVPCGVQALAETMKDAETIAIMNRLADEYDKLGYPCCRGFSFAVKISVI